MQRLVDLGVRWTEEDMDSLRAHFIALVQDRLKRYRESPEGNAVHARYKKDYDYYEDVVAQPFNVGARVMRGVTNHPESPSKDTVMKLDGTYYTLASLPEEIGGLFTGVSLYKPSLQIPLARLTQEADLLTLKLLSSTATRIRWLYQQPEQDRMQVALCEFAAMTPAICSLSYEGICAETIGSGSFDSVTTHPFKPTLEERVRELFALPAGTEVPDSPRVLLQMIRVASAAGLVDGTATSQVAANLSRAAQQPLPEAERAFNTQAGASIGHMFPEQSDTHLASIQSDIKHLRSFYIAAGEIYDKPVVRPDGSVGLRDMHVSHVRLMLERYGMQELFPGMGADEARPLFDALLKKARALVNRRNSAFTTHHANVNALIDDCSAYQMPFERSLETRAALGEFLEEYLDLSEQQIYALKYIFEEHPIRIPPTVAALQFNTHFCEDLDAAVSDCLTISQSTWGHGLACALDPDMHLLSLNWYPRREAGKEKGHLDDDVKTLARAVLMETDQGLYVDGVSALPYVHWMDGNPSRWTDLFVERIVSFSRILQAPAIYVNIRHPPQNKPAHELVTAFARHAGAHHPSPFAFVTYNAGKSRKHRHEVYKPEQPDQLLVPLRKRHARDAPIFLEGAHLTSNPRDVFSDSRLSMDDDEKRKLACGEGPFYAFRIPVQ